MPRGDGTGPRGAGPRTGRGLGTCPSPEADSLYQAVIGKYGERANVWMVTLRDGDGWEQTIYVIASDKEFARSIARARTSFDRPRFVETSSTLLYELDPAEVEAFIGPSGQPQNIIVFDAEPEE